MKTSANTFSYNLTVEITSLLSPLPGFLVQLQHEHKYCNHLSAPSFPGVEVVKMRCGAAAPN